MRKQVRVAQIRRHAEELSSGLYQKQVASRQILAGLYGADRNFELAAISGRTPETPQILAEQVDQTVKLLRDPEGPAPIQKIGGVTMDFEAMAGELETGQAELQGVRVDFDRMLKTADRTRALTNQAIDEFNSVFPWVVQSLEGLFRLVGERELADRIRTTARRVTRRRGEDGEEEPSGESEIPATLEPASPPSEASDVTLHAGTS